MDFASVKLVENDALASWCIIWRGAALIKVGRADDARLLLQQHARLLDASATICAKMWLHAVLRGSAPRKAEHLFQQIAKAGVAGYGALIRPLLKDEDVSKALTEAEREVLILLDRGMRPKRIAEEFGKKESTVRNQIQSIIQRLNARGTPPKRLCSLEPTAFFSHSQSLRRNAPENCRFCLLGLHKQVRKKRALAFYRYRSFMPAPKRRSSEENKRWGLSVTGQIAERVSPHRVAIEDA